MNEKIKIYDEKMQKTIDHLEADYQGIRAGRANPHVLDRLRVDYYGTPTPIQQVGNVTIPEARMIQSISTAVKVKMPCTLVERESCFKL